MVAVGCSAEHDHGIFQGLLSRGFLARGTAAAGCSSSCCPRRALRALTRRGKDSLQPGLHSGRLLPRQQPAEDRGDLEHGEGPVGLGCRLDELHVGEEGILPEELLLAPSSIVTVQKFGSLTLTASKKAEG